MEKPFLPWQKNPKYSLINNSDTYNKYRTKYELVLWGVFTWFCKRCATSALYLYIQSFEYYNLYPSLISFMSFFPHVLFTFKAIFIPSYSYLFKSLPHICYITFLRLSCAWIYVPDVLGHLPIVSIDVFCAYISTDTWFLRVYFICKTH